MRAFRTRTWSAPGVVVVLALAGPGCTPQAPSLPGPSEQAAERGARPHGDQQTGAVVIHVDAAAAPGGDGSTWQAALTAVTPAIAAACASEGERTVLVAGGDYFEKEIPVPCAVDILGVNPVVVSGPDGLPDGVNAGVARIIADPPLQRLDNRGNPPGHSEAVFRVTSSDVSIESLSIDGGNIPGFNYRVGSGIEIGGGTGDVGTVDPRCPETAGIDDVAIHDVAVTGTGIGVFASYADIWLSGSFLSGNGIGASINAGDNAEAFVVGNTFRANGLYGLGTYGGGAYDIMPCAYDVENPTATKLTAHVIGNEISYHAWQGGYRLLTRLHWGGAGQPDVPVMQETEVMYNVFEGNNNYGAFIDFVAFTPVETEATYEGTFLFNEFVGNTRAPLHVGFTHINFTAWYEALGWDPLFAHWGEDYVWDSSAELTVWPPVQVDWNNPVEGCVGWADTYEGPFPPTEQDCGDGTHFELGNTLTVNGDAYIGRHITPR